VIRINEIPKLTDVHVHLDFYPVDQMEQVLRRADEAGVRWMVTSGWGIPSAQRGVEIATQSKEPRSKLRGIEGQEARCLNVVGPYATVRCSTVLYHR